MPQPKRLTVDKLKDAHYYRVLQHGAGGSTQYYRYNGKSHTFHPCDKNGARSGERTGISTRDESWGWGADTFYEHYLVVFDCTNGNIVQSHMAHAYASADKCDYSDVINLRPSDRADIYHTLPAERDILYTCIEVAEEGEHTELFVKFYRKGLDTMAEVYLTPTTAYAGLISAEEFAKQYAVTGYNAKHSVIGAMKPNLGEAPMTDPKHPFYEIDFTQLLTGEDVTLALKQAEVDDGFIVSNRKFNTLHFAFVVANAIDPQEPNQLVMTDVYGVNVGDGVWELAECPDCFNILCPFAALDSTHAAEDKTKVRKLVDALLNEYGLTMYDAPRKSKKIPLDVANNATFPLGDLDEIEHELIASTVGTVWEAKPANHTKDPIPNKYFAKLLMNLGAKTQVVTECDSYGNCSSDYMGFQEFAMSHNLISVMPCRANDGQDNITYLTSVPEPADEDAMLANDENYALSATPLDYTEAEVPPMTIESMDFTALEMRMAASLMDEEGRHTFARLFEEGQRAIRELKAIREAQ